MNRAFVHYPNITNDLEWTVDKAHDVYYIDHCNVLPFVDNNPALQWKLGKFWEDWILLCKCQPKLSSNNKKNKSLFGRDLKRAKSAS